MISLPASPNTVSSPRRERNSWLVSFPVKESFASVPRIVFWMSMSWAALESKLSMGEGWGGINAIPGCWGSGWQPQPVSGSGTGLNMGVGSGAGVGVVLGWVLEFVSGRGWGRVFELEWVPGLVWARVLELELVPGLVWARVL